jgi:hypothetical protein
MATLADNRALFYFVPETAERTDSIVTAVSTGVARGPRCEPSRAATGMEVKGVEPSEQR